MCNLAHFQETFWSIQALFIHERQLSELGRYEHKASITALTHSSCIDCASHSSLGKTLWNILEEKKTHKGCRWFIKFISQPSVVVFSQTSGSVFTIYRTRWQWLPFDAIV